MNTVERRVRAMINPWSTALTRWWCHWAARFALTGHGALRGRGRDVPRPTPADAPADGMPQAVRIEALTQADVASAVALAVRVLRVKPGDRGQQFASDITDELRQMFVAKSDGQVVGYKRAFAHRAPRADRAVVVGPDVPIAERKVTATGPERRALSGAAPPASRTLPPVASPRRWAQAPAWRPP